MYDGHLNKCKDCTKKDVSENYDFNKIRPEFVEKERKRGREKHHRLYSKSNANLDVDFRKINRSEEEIKENKSISMKKYNETFPEKYKAKIASQRVFIKHKSNHRHHWSYNEEHHRDIIELSPKEHAKTHRFIIYDQERFMYRTYDTNELLDTKEKHEKFIRMCIETKED